MMTFGHAFPIHVKDTCRSGAGPCELRLSPADTWASGLVGRGGPNVATSRRGHLLEFSAPAGHSPRRDGQMLSRHDPRVSDLNKLAQGMRDHCLRGISKFWASTPIVASLRIFGP